MNFSHMFLTALSLSAASLAATIPATAQVALGGMITGQDVDRIREIAQTYGTAERRQDRQGVYIRGEVDGTIYSISLLNCDDNDANCTTVQFRSWWDTQGAIPLEAMNQWNRDRRFSAAYLDEDNNATIEWDVNLAGGVTAVNFDDDLQWWLLVMRQFRDTVIHGGDDRSSAPSTPPSTQPAPSK